MTKRQKIIMWTFGLLISAILFNDTGISIRNPRNEFVTIILPLLIIGFMSFLSFGEKRQNSQYTNIMLELNKLKEQVSKSTETDDRTEDELYEEAKETVIEFQRASTAFIQRTLGVGYARAARIIDLLEERGVIGKQIGTKARDIFIKEEE